VTSAGKVRKDDLKSYTFARDLSSFVNLSARLYILVLFYYSLLVVQFGCMLFVLVSLAPMAAVSGAVADALLSALGGNPLAGDEDLPPSSTSSAKVSCLRSH